MSSQPYKLLDLFSGIGGFSLGLERSGAFETVAFCEIEPFPRKVLAKHWPKVPCYDDIRTLTAARLAADGIAVDAICGGFPCQDISTAGQGRGLDGERSGLWFEYARLVGELRPKYVIVENVAALLGRGLEQVLGSLAKIGYDAEWHCISAAAIGAPHRRDRVWIIANTNDNGWNGTENAESYFEGNVGSQARPLEPLKSARSSDMGKTYADVKERLLPTPCARDWKDNGTSPAELRRNSATLATIAGGQLNPMWVEWLMGYPTGWTGLKG